MGELFSRKNLGTSLIGGALLAFAVYVLMRASVNDAGIIAALGCSTILLAGTAVDFFDDMHQSDVQTAMQGESMQ